MARTIKTKFAKCCSVDDGRRTFPRQRLPALAAQAIPCNHFVRLRGRNNLLKTANKRLDLSKLQTNPLFGRLIAISFDRRNKGAISFAADSDLDIDAHSILAKSFLEVKSCHQFDQAATLPSPHFRPLSIWMSRLPRWRRNCGINCRRTT